MKKKKKKNEKSQFNRALQITHLKTLENSPQAANYWITISIK